MTTGLDATILYKSSVAFLELSWAGSTTGDLTTCEINCRKSKATKFATPRPNC